jgi:hypothetical protein
MDDPTDIAGGHIEPVAPASPAVGASDAMPTMLGVVRSQAILWPAHIMVADTARGAAITKFRGPVPATGPRSTEKPSMGCDPDPEKFRADEHPEASIAVSNRTVAMPDRRLAASMTSQDVNGIHIALRLTRAWKPIPFAGHAQIVAPRADCELVPRQCRDTHGRRHTAPRRWAAHRTSYGLRGDGFGTNRPPVQIRQPRPVHKLCERQSACRRQTLSN